MKRAGKVKPAALVSCPLCGGAAKRGRARDRVRRFRVREQLLLFVRGDTTAGECVEALCAVSDVCSRCAR